MDRKKLREETRKVNGVLKYIHTKDITDLLDLIRCAAVVVGERVGARKRVRKP